MMTSGRHIGTGEALDAGLSTTSSTAASAALRDAAVAFANQAVAENLPLARVRDRDENVARGYGQRRAVRRLPGVDRPQDPRVPRPRVHRPVHRGGREPAVRRGHEGRGQLFMELMTGPQSARAALLVLRRASRQQDPRHRQGHTDHRHPDLRRSRRRHDGRRHRDELRQRRHSRDDRRARPGRTRPGPRQSSARTTSGRHHAGRSRPRRSSNAWR